MATRLVQQSSLHLSSPANNATDVWDNEFEITYSGTISGHRLYINGELYDEWTQDGVNLLSPHTITLSRDKLTEGENYTWTVSLRDAGDDSTWVDAEEIWSFTTYSLANHITIDDISPENGADCPLWPGYGIFIQYKKTGDMPLTNQLYLDGEYEADFETSFGYWDYETETSPDISLGEHTWSIYANKYWTKTVIKISEDYTFNVVGPPEKPINPTPANGATDVTLDQATISWEDGGGATSYNVYYGENEEGLTLVSEGQSETSFTITGIDYGSPFEYVVSRAWRIDAINEYGTTTGDVWTFTTIKLNPPLATGLSLDSGGGNEGTGTTGTPTGENNIITIKRLVAAAANTIWYEDI